MIAVTIDVPQADVDRMNATLTRYAEYFKGNMPKTLEKTMVKIITALRAGNTTIVSDKVRKIVPFRKFAKNSGDKFLRAHDHIRDNYINKPSANKTGHKAAWLPPLKALGKDGRTATLAIERYTQSKGIKYTPITAASKVGDAKAIAQFVYPRIYNITRRGLARSSWGWMLRQLRKSVTTDQPEIDGTVSVSRSNISMAGQDNIVIEATNKLNYIRKATKANISTVLARASRMMIDEIEGHKKGAASRAGPRAA